MMKGFHVIKFTNFAVVLMFPENRTLIVPLLANNTIAPFEIRE